VYDLVRTALDAGTSNSEVRRLIAHGGVQLDGTKLQDQDELVSINPDGSTLKIGKRRWYQIRTSAS
jgi:tyrosyl-tRNA synthetase